MKIRPVERSDTEGIIALIAAAYREHGDRLCLEGADADLANVAGHYSSGDSAFVVLDDNGTVAGTHALVPVDVSLGLCTFRRLYLRSDLRGTGWGDKLMRWAIDTARQFGFRRVEFWSDTRFTRAHQFFRRLGFQDDGRVREMNDAWKPYSEFFFWKELTEYDGSGGHRL